ncbi:MAG: hypothetical protein EA349_05290 [Halomonadaceae bacterium]|nr:MAG: hypothetical protein EA349_05290 [Halomonadaceae bacterium]
MKGVFMANWLGAVLLGMCLPGLIAAEITPAIGTGTHGDGTGAATDAPKELVLWRRNYQSSAVRALVELALEQTPEYPPVILVPSESTPQGRALRELNAGNHGQVAIANVATSPEREKNLLPIAIPFDRGLLGFRVCLIREGEQHRFSGIQDVEQFNRRGLLIGQGTHWPDRIILQANGLNVVSVPRFESLFPMLRRSRFDCFLRGASEVLIDMEQQDMQGLTVETDLLIQYQMPSYLFVSPDNIVLAQRLELGLRRAIESGAFDRYFDRHFRRAIEQLRLYERHFIVLQNPFMDELTTEKSLPVMPLQPDTLRPFPADLR